MQYILEICINSYYNLGYSDGLAKINNASVSYTYHSHSDSCYATESCRATPSERVIGSKTWIGYSHSACGQAWAGIDWKEGSSGYSGNYYEYSHEYKYLVCGKNEGDIEEAVITY